MKESKAHKKINETNTGGSHFMYYDTVVVLPLPSITMYVKRHQKQRTCKE